MDVAELRALIKRLRAEPYYERKPLDYGLMDEAAAALFELTAERDTERSERVGLSEHVRYTEHLLEAAEARNRELAAALEMIAGKRQCRDDLMSNADIARAALSPTNKGDAPT